MIDNKKVALVGCGYWGKNLVRNVHELGALTRVCDLTETGRAKAKEIAPDVEVVDTINAALTDDIDGILIATPAETHYEIAKQAFPASINMFAVSAGFFIITFYSMKKRCSFITIPGFNLCTLFNLCFNCF